ncbi:MAG TPA: phospholipase D-like domain-containing protein [Acidobacteriota bacterium]|nr:phospholipase D-like domain-containing protein [Acidobacteriota bacterium]
MTRCWRNGAPQDRSGSPSTYPGSHGSLHAKCAIVDGRRIFISSANLTEFALNLNMEMGVLIESSDLAQQAEKHIKHLITYGLLRCLESS